MKIKKLTFECSNELKQLLAEPLEEWKKKKGDYGELAEKCGVTPAYLSQLKTYGRIPGRSVLVLLAFNLDVSGQQIFSAARLSEEFPYQANLTITEKNREANDLISLNFNTDNFTNLIRNVVRTEMRQRNVKDLLAGRPLRMGVNYNHYWLFGSQTPPSDNKHTGFYPEFCKMLGLALQKEIELVYIPFADYRTKLTTGQIDLFGPTMIVPNLASQIHFSLPIYRLGVSAIMRKRKSTDLPDLPEPKTIPELRDEKYKIAVLRNSLPHLIANTKLKRSDESLILCSSDEEGIERVTLRGLNRPAHLFLTNSMTAILTAKKQPKDLLAVFNQRENLLDLAEESIAIRPDWPEIIPVINDAIRFLQSRDGLPERLAHLHGAEAASIIEIIRTDRN